MKAYVQTCNVCQRIKVFKYKFYEKLSFLFVSEVSWKKFFMNLIIDLSSSKRENVVYDAILVIVDKCTKMIKYLSMIIKIDVAKLTNLFFEKIVLHFDIPANIINDRDSLFINAFWSALCYHVKIKRRLSTVFHSQTNEQITKQNQILKHYLRSYVDAKQTEWANLLSLTKFAYNNFTHAFVNASPFYLMYKYNSKIHYEVEDNFIKRRISSAKERVKQFHNIRNQLMQRLQKVSAQQTKYYNASHQSKSYAVNDLMLLSIKNLKQKRLNKKLSHRFVDSFRMKNKIDEQTYRLTLSNTYSIYNIFHMSFLKSYLHCVDDQETKVMMQASKLINDIEQWEIKKIMNRTKSKKKIWYKIKWLDWDHIYDQWLPEEELKHT